MTPERITSAPATLEQAAPEHSVAPALEQATVNLEAAKVSEFAPSPSRPERWSAERAWEWHFEQSWRVGCNFLPSSAVNDVEMWQADTFDPATMERELGWAQGLGFNAVRVFVNYVVWEADGEGLKTRFNQFLQIAQERGQSVMPVLFDDCAFAGKAPFTGKQDEPVPGVHNSAWVPSPAPAMVEDTGTWPRLEAYIRDMVGTFGQDQRVLCWDVYNEPGNSQLGDRSLPLVEAAFGWARRESPVQPLTVGAWGGSPLLTNRALELSDLTSFHNYSSLVDMKMLLPRLSALGRPVYCTEWMARALDSRFETHLPFFKAFGISCWSWGLAAGRTQTYFPWNHPKDGPAPAVWFHDIFTPDGTPFSQEEVRAIQSVTQAQP